MSQVRRGKGPRRGAESKGARIPPAPTRPAGPTRAAPPPAPVERRSAGGGAPAAGGGPAAGARGRGGEGPLGGGVGAGRGVSGTLGRRGPDPCLRGRNREREGGRESWPLWRWRASALGPRARVGDVGGTARPSPSRGRWVGTGPPGTVPHRLEEPHPHRGVGALPRLSRRPQEELGRRGGTAGVRRLTNGTGRDSRSRTAMERPVRRGRHTSTLPMSAWESPGPEEGAVPLPSTSRSLSGAPGDPSRFGPPPTEAETMERYSVTGDTPEDEDVPSGSNRRHRGRPLHPDRPRLVRRRGVPGGGVKSYVGCRWYRCRRWWWWWW